MTYRQGKTDQTKGLLSVMKGVAIMKRIFFGTGTLVLGLAALLWATAPISAQRGGGGHGGYGGGHAGGGHAAAHVGSVHYGARPAPARVAPFRVAPAVWAGAVRSEHYAGSAFGGAYRNPYRDEYFRHFRPGYRSFLIGDASYYYYDDLPPDYQTVVIDGITYYLYDGVYYQAYLYGGQTVYMVVPTQ
jgi:hypothetical protein